MKIGVNVSFARKPDSGMGQVTINFLRELVRIQGSKSSSRDEFFLYLEEDLPNTLQLPENFHKRIFLPVYKRDDLIRKIWWEKYLLPKKAKQDGCEVFLSLYQSASIFKKITHVMFVHDAIWKIFPQYLSNSRKKIYYRLVGKAIKEADKVLTNSENSKKDIAEIFGISVHEIAVYPLDCDPVFKKEMSNQQVSAVLQKYDLMEKSVEGKVEKTENGSGRGYIFYVGGFDVRKNVRGLLEAYGLFWKRYSNEMEIPRLVLAGNFNPRLVPLVTNVPEKIKELEEKYGCPQKQIKLIGFVAQEDLPALYQGADFFCYPSLYEGFGLPVLEAANSGCAIVTSKISSIPEVIDEKGAFFVDPRQHEDIAKTMHLALSDKAMKQQKILEAKSQAKKFDWKHTIEKTISTIQTVSKTKNS